MNKTNEPKKSLLPIEENKEFERKLKQLEGIKFDSLQDYIIALDKMYSINQSTKLIMKKSKIIYGLPASGKTLKAKEIAKDYTNPKFILASTKTLGSITEKIKDDTDLLVIDGCTDDFNYSDCISQINEGIEKDMTSTRPDLIFVTQSMKFKPSLFEQVDFIECIRA